MDCLKQTCQAGKGIDPARTCPLPFKNRSQTYPHVSWLASQIQGALSWDPGALSLPSKMKRPSFQPSLIAHGVPGSPHDSNDQLSASQPLEPSSVITHLPAIQRQGSTAFCLPTPTQPHHSLLPGMVLTDDPVLLPQTKQEDWYLALAKAYGF